MYFCKLIESWSKYKLAAVEKKLHFWSTPVKIGACLRVSGRLDLKLFLKKSAVGLVYPECLHPLGLPSKSGTTKQDIKVRIFAE